MNNEASRKAGAQAVLDLINNQHVCQDIGKQFVQSYSNNGDKDNAVDRLIGALALLRFLSRNSFDVGSAGTVINGYLSQVAPEILSFPKPSPKPVIEPPKFIFTDRDEDEKPKSKRTKKKDVVE